ncbi:unnamed protein product [Acanthoscelides obtectus]|nr:unnamed protein product [Acanthoscelides obtectus]CAK1662531.1 hypothetical protein AOBTE_LOCUS23198 [Acanthoscelides obtectus]
MFFSQFILYAHTDLPASEGKFEFYRDTIDLFYQFCCHSLETDHFEVGLQVAQIILNILSGSYKKLLLIYKLERKYYYEEGENALFQRLKGKFLKFTSLKFQNKLKQCLLMKGGTSKCLTNLILSHYPQVCFLDIATFRKILSESAKISSLKNIEKISNLSRISLNDRNPSNIAFVNKTVDIVLEDMNDFETTSTYSNVLLLTVINVATQNLFIIDSLPVLIEKCFDYMLFQINQNASSKMAYQSLKTYEAFINTIVNITIQKLDSLWPNLNRNFVIDALMKIIGISNMKKPVTISAIALKHLFVKMEECDIMYKMLLSDEVLRCISDVPTRSDLKIRRYPEYRLVLHALCMSDNNPSRLFLKWIIQDLIQIIKNDESSDIAVSRSIHSIEILVSENTLHSHTLFYMEEIIILCIELFKNESWIIRNADLQLAKALIDRFFGVSLNTCNRPKTIEDLFVLFPNLPSYFFKILSMEILDERASMAFQFFLESQIKTSLWTHVTGECLSYFRVLFIDIIKNYPNHFGKLAVKSLVALTMNDDIPNVVLDICSYIKSNFINMRSNIISNVIFLVKELHEKYAKGSMNSTSTEVYLHGLSEFLRKHNSCVFDFMLLKVNTSSVVMNKIKSFNDNDFQNRIWLNNYIPLLVNSKYYLQYLDDILSFNLPVCQKVKVLSMLVSKFERGCLKPADMPVVFKIIVQNCISEDDKYLLLCYYKVASLIISSIQVDVNIDNELFPSKFNSLYKAHVFVLYQSISKASILKTFQLDSIVKLYSTHVGMTDDIDSDIAYSLKYFPEDISADLKYILYKIVFCYSLQQTTYLEIYNFITEKTKKRYYSILPALECLLSQSFITKTLGVYSDIFYCNINRYVKEMCKNSGEQNGFYEIQIDFVVPIDFLAKLLKIKDLYS